MPNLVFLFLPSLQIMGKTLARMFSWFVDMPCKNKNCCDCRTSNDIDIKLAPVTKPDYEKYNKVKKIDEEVVAANYNTIFPFYG